MRHAEIDDSSTGPQKSFQLCLACCRRDALDEGFPLLLAHMRLRLRLLLRPVWSLQKVLM